MRLVGFIGALVAFGAAVLASGCSPRQWDGTSLPEASILQTPHRASVYLYVVNDRGRDAVEVFGPGGSTALRTYPSEGATTAIALDPNGALYATQTYPPRGGLVHAYAPGSTTRTATITDGIDTPVALAFDAAGTLYVANANGGGGAGTVTEYRRGKIHPFQTIGGPKDCSALCHPAALALDGAGNLYVLSGGNCVDGVCQRSSVSVYSPGRGTSQLTIPTSGYQIAAIAVDPTGRLFVVTPASNAVSIYEPGQTQASRRISRGLCEPWSLAIDLRRNLYVGNLYDVCHPNENVTVDAFSPKGALIRRISAGVNWARAIAVDSSGGLYVANTGTVTVYRPGQKKPARTIRDGISYPFAFAIGSQ